MKKTLFTLIFMILIFFACAMNMSTACEISLFLSSYRDMILNQWVHVFLLDYFLNNHGETSVEWTLN